MKSQSLKVVFKKIGNLPRIPEVWSVADYRQILNVLEFDDADSVSDGDVEEMALMALQDLEPEEAAREMLTHFTEKRFSRGQIQNLCEDLKEVCAWEEYPALEHQYTLYRMADLLNKAFPAEYPEPSICQARLRITGTGISHLQRASPLDRATLLRLLGRCQEANGILNRFFTEQIKGAPFPEATWVIWEMDVAIEQEDTLTVLFYGSAYWFRDLETGDEYTREIVWPEKLQINKAY